MTEATDFLLPLLQAGGGALAAITSRLVYRGWRLSRSRPLFAFWTGFALLAAAQFTVALTDVLTLNDPEVPINRLDQFDLLFWLHNLAFLAGLVAIFVSFGRHPFKWSFVLAPVVLVAGPLFLFLHSIVLFFIVLHAGLNHIGRARPGSLQTATGFFFLLLAQFLFLNDVGALLPDSTIWTTLFPPFDGSPSPLNPHHLGGELFTLVGYVLLYLAVARPRGST